MYVPTWAIERAIEWASGTIRHHDNHQIPPTVLEVSGQHSTLQTVCPTHAATDIQDMQAREVTENQPHPGAMAIIPLTKELL